MDSDVERCMHFNTSTRSGRHEPKPRRKARSTQLHPREKKSAFTILSRFFSRQLVNSILYTMAESFLKRIKYCLMQGWNRRHLSKPNNILTFQPGAESGGTASCMSSNNNRRVSEGSARETQTPLREWSSGIDCNANAQSSSASSRMCNECSQKRHTKTARRIVAKYISRSRQNPREQRKESKVKPLDRTSQLSKNIYLLRKKYARLKKQIVKVPTRNGIVKALSVTGSQNTDALRQKASKTSQPNEVPCRREHELSVPKSDRTSQRFEMAPCNDNERETMQEIRKRKERRTRQKRETLLNKLVTDPNTDVGSEFRETQKRFPRKKNKQMQCNTDKIMAQSHLGPSSFSFKMDSPDINDWPSLVEMERPKGLIKEAATEIVRSKQVGSSFGTKTCAFGASQPTTSSYGFVSQQYNTMNNAANHRTWASVAAQPLASAAKVTFGYTTETTSCQSNTAEKIENTIKYKPPQSEPNKPPQSEPKKPPQHELNKTLRKRKVGSKLECSNRPGADYFKNKDKSNPRKLHAENDERIKKLNIIRSRRNTMKQRCGQMDEASELSVSHKNKKVMKAGKSEGKTEKRKTRQSLNNNWQIDEMPVVYTQPAGSVTVLAEQLESDTTNQATAGSATMESLNRITSVTCTQGEKSWDAEDDLGQCSHLGWLTAKSDESVDLNDDCRIDRKNSSFVSCHHNPLANKCQRTFPKEEEAKKQKKVSAKYRELLRGNSGRLDVKTATEMQNRNKMIQNLQQDKISLRQKQRQMRQDKQRSQLSSHQSPAGMCTDSCGESKTPRKAGRRMSPYWLRSNPANNDLVQGKTQSKIPEANQTGEETKSSGTRNVIPTTPITNTVRRSERLGSRCAMKNTGGFCQ